MPYPIENKFVIAISASALFDTKEDERVFKDNGIEAYRAMIQSSAKKIDFKARVDEETTRKLLGKHTDPIPYILPKLVERAYKKEDEDPIRTWELNELILFLAKKEGVSINKLDNKGRIQAKYLVETIRSCFDFGPNWTTASYSGDKKIRIYPNLCRTNEYCGFLSEMNKAKEK